jgi:hypothetical protein
VLDPRFFPRASFGLRLLTLADRHSLPAKPITHARFQRLAITTWRPAFYRP